MGIPSITIKGCASLSIDETPLNCIYAPAPGSPEFLDILTPDAFPERAFISDVSDAPSTISEPTVELA